MNFPLTPPPMPPIHFVGERLPGVMAAVREAFNAGFDAGAAGGGLAGLTVGSVLGATAASLVWTFILFCTILICIALRKR